MVGIVILIGLAVALLVLWCVIVAVGIVIPPPPIDQFVPRAEVDSDLVSSVPMQALQRAAKAMAGVRLVGSTDASLRTVDTHVSRLRSALGLTAESGVRMVPVYGYGYRLEVSPRDGT